jgi:hypothetical protein
MSTATSAPSKLKTDVLRSLLMDYADTQLEQAQEVIEQYLWKLISILTDLQAGGYDTRNLEQLFISVLLDKEKGGYINHACELAAAAYFMENFPEGFRYQVEGVATAPLSGTGPPKTFDFSFVADSHVFNVEVKTFTPNLINNNASPIKVFLPYNSTKALYSQGMRFSSNLAPKIGRFLEDANTQLVRPKDGLSVVLLCCNDLDEYTDALTCFIGRHGICNNKAKEGLVPSPADLPNIDAIVISNLGFNHNAVVNPQRIRHFYHDESVHAIDGAAAWDYALALPTGFFLCQEPRTESLLKTFMTAFGSHNLHVFNLMEQNGGDVQRAVFDLFNATNNSS